MGENEAIEEIKKIFLEEYKRKHKRGESFNFKKSHKKIRRK